MTNPTITTTLITCPACKKPVEATLTLHVTTGEATTMADGTPNVPIDFEFIHCSVSHECEPRRR